MPGNGPTAVNEFIHYHLVRLVDLVDIDVKIIIDDIASRCNE